MSLPSLSRHRHLHSYASVVLGGSFTEAGYLGRISASVGDIILHPSLDCHTNPSISTGFKLLRLEWVDMTGIGGLFFTDRIDEIAHVAEKDVYDAAILLREIVGVQCCVSPRKQNDWPDMLAHDLAQGTSIEIGAWAEMNNLARETVSRGFVTAYGIGPAAYKAELRTRKAWLRVTRSTHCLSYIAAETGFADQSHMTRWIHRMTGASPARWRQGLSCSP